MSVEVERSVLGFGEKKLFDISLELDYSSESYMISFGILPFGGKRVLIALLVLVFHRSPVMDFCMS